jgi:hypothetical protein
LRISKNPGLFRLNLLWTRFNSRTRLEFFALDYPHIFLKMRSIRPSWLVLPIALLCAAQSWADSVTLKTGEQITGTIKSQTDTEVVIDVPVSASITDERTIEKTDIAKIDQAQPDQIAYQQLIQVQPNPQSSYSSDAYDQILGSLNAFIANYPNSTYLPEIKKLAATFQEEKKHVDNGEYKYLGKWISHDEAQRRSSQIAAQQAFATMQQQATSGDFVGAMQTFAVIDQSYRTMRCYPQAVALAQQILARLVPELTARLQALKAQEVQMRQTIAATTEPEKSNLIAQNKAEQDRAAAVIAASVRSGARWVPLIPDSEVSITTLQKVAMSDAQRLASVPVAAMNQSIARVDSARTAIASHDYTSANVLLVQATNLWNQNEDARYTLTQLKTELATPTPKPTPVVLQTPRPTPTPNLSVIATPTPAAPAKPFYMTIPGALSIVAGVLILAGVVAIAGKLKAKNEDAE